MYILYCVLGHVFQQKFTEQYYFLNLILKIM